MTCDHVRDHDLVDQYLHRRLADADRDAFEAHFLDCDACFALVQDYRLLRQEFAAAPVVAAEPERTRFGLGIRGWSVIGAVAALTLAVVGTLLFRSAPANSIAAVEAPSAPPVTTAAAPPSPATTPSRGERVMQLARFEPPTYVPLSLRDAGDARAPEFDAAMTAYRAGNYAAAAAALRPITAGRPASIDALFYLGVSDLQQGRVAEALSSFTSVLNERGSVYEEDSLYLSAKASLQQGDVAAARRALARVSALDGDRASDARNLIAAIDALPSS